MIVFFFFVWKSYASTESKTNKQKKPAVHFSTPYSTSMNLHMFTSNSLERSIFLFVPKIGCYVQFILVNRGHLRAETRQVRLTEVIILMAF